MLPPLLTSAFNYTSKPLTSKCRESRKPFEGQTLGRPNRAVVHPRSFREGKYVHSDMAWDISRNSLELLERIVEEVLRVVHTTIDEGFLRKGISA